MRFVNRFYKKCFHQSYTAILSTIFCNKQYSTLKKMNKDMVVRIGCKSGTVDRCRFVTYSSSRKRSRELVVLVLVGITAGVVYGLNKKYEREKRDQKLDEINRLMKNAESLDENDTKAAIQLYEETLRLVKVQIDSEETNTRMALLTTKFAFIVDQLANISHKLGLLTDAEDYYKQTLQTLLTHGTHQDSDAVIEISLKLASIYAEQKRDVLAENGYMWCIEKARNKLKENNKDKVNSSALLGICLESFGKYLISRRHYSKAIALFSEALEISKSIYDENHEQVVVLLNDLGVASFELGDSEASKSYLNKAIALSGHHHDLWTFHLNLANVLAQSGDIEEARRHYHHSIKICPDEIKKIEIEEQMSKLP